MKRLIFLAVTLLSALPLLAADQWMHVRLEGHGADGGSLSFTFPLSAVQKSLPAMIPLDGARHHVVINGRELKRDDLRRIVNSVRTIPDGGSVSVHGHDGDARLSRVGDSLVLTAEHDGSDRTELRMPIWLADALLAGRDDSLDIRSGINALIAHGSGAISVSSDGESVVRVWIDGSGD